MKALSIPLVAKSDDSDNITISRRWEILETRCRFGVVRQGRGAMSALRPSRWFSLPADCPKSGRTFKIAGKVNAPDTFCRSGPLRSSIRGPATLCLGTDCKVGYDVDHVQKADIDVIQEQPHLGEFEVFGSRIKARRRRVEEARNEN